jgi:hypothetical protein
MTKYNSMELFDCPDYVFLPMRHHWPDYTGRAHAPTGKPPQRSHPAGSVAALGRLPTLAPARTSRQPTSIVPSRDECRTWSSCGLLPILSGTTSSSSSSVVACHRDPLSSTHLLSSHDPTTRTCISCASEARPVFFRHVHLHILLETR